MQKKKGISLIVLVITIIVMIILAAAIILTLNNSGIINRANEAVEKTDLAQVKHIATLKWSEAYLGKKTSQSELYNAVIDGLKKEKINLDNYDITVTESGVDLALKEKVPTEWTENVTAIVDGVPIPKGFIASPYEGEKTKNGGLVIYELNEEETTIPTEETQQTSWTTRNQYVWVPVDKEAFTTKFVRKDFISPTSKVVDANGKYNALGISELYWEVIVDEATNLPLTTIENQSTTYMSEATLAEVQAMYASVKEYGGFYIARYEAGIDSQRTSATATLITGTNVHSKMCKIPYTNIKWSTSSTMNVDTAGAVEVARGLYPSNDETNTTGVVSTLIYGVQWDRTLEWWQELDSKFSVISSTSYGNYADHEITTYDLNAGALVWDYTASSNGSYVSKDDASLTYPKSSGTSWALSTGALKEANVNNIYDMAGNMLEWTMEGSSTSYRIGRGGSFGAYGTLGKYPVAHRAYSAPSDGYVIAGFRASLYIKK